MRLHALQYLRAVAALAVVYSHSAIQVEPYTAYLPHTGGFGVDVFFVISGFIMVWIARPEDTPGRFMANRVRRVVPLYWFFTLVMALILVALPTLFRSTTFEWSTFLMSLAFVPHESRAHPGWLWPIVAPGWSLNYEMYFYLLFALSLLLPPARRVAGVIALLGAIVLLAWWSGSDAPPVRFYGNPIVFEFAFGMLLAVAWRRGLRVPPAVAVLLIVGGSALLIAPLPVPHILMYGVPSLMVVAGAVWLPLPERRWGVLLGDASYALYLSHLFALGALRKVLPPLLGEGPLAAWSFVAISLLLCTLVGVAVHLLVDNWLLRHERLGRFGRLASGAPAPTTPGTAPRAARSSGAPGALRGAADEGSAAERRA